MSSRSGGASPVTAASLGGQGAAGRGRSPRAALLWGLLVLAALLPYGNAMRCGFTFDDTAIILENPAISGDDAWWTPFAEPYWPAPHAAGLYRPLTSASYRLQLALTGTAAAPFHALNLLLHAAVTLLAYAVLRAVLRDRLRLAWAIALLFAVHPLHTEAVTGIVGRAELLAALCGLGGYLLWREAARTTSPTWSGVRTVAIALLFLLAMASKESAVGWLLLLAAHRLGLLGDGRGYRSLAAQEPAARRRARTADLAALSGCGVYLAARVAVLGTLFGLADVTLIENPIYATAPAVRWLTAFKVLAKGIGLHLWPVGLCADYSFRSFPLETRALGLGGLAALLSILVLAVALAVRRRAPALLWSLLLAVALYLPVSNLAFPIGTIMAERLWYLPSLGWIAAVTWALASAAAWRPLVRYRAAALLVVLLLLAGCTWQRNRAWQSNATLFRAAVAAVPDNAKARVNLAAALVRQGETGAAEQHYQHALEVAPDYLPALTGLGHLRILAAQYVAADSLLSRATALYPESADAWIRLGNLMLELERGAAAQGAFSRALALHPDEPRAWIGQASALFMLQRYDASADAWARALELADDRRPLRHHAAAAARKAGRLAQAETWLTEQRAAEPENAALIGELADLRLQRRDRGPDALQLARDAVAREPSDRHLEILVRHLLLRGRCDEARAVLSSAAALQLGSDPRAALRQLIADSCATP